MAREIEIKLRIIDAMALKRAIKRLGGRPVGGGTGRVQERNVIFDTPDGRLAKRGQLLRIRTEAQNAKSKNSSSLPKLRTILTFKRPIRGGKAPSNRPQGSSRHKLREEFEFELADAGALAKILEGLGMRGWFRYEKYRTTFRLPAALTWGKGLLIELDETPIGTFVELEGPSAAIDRAARELGYDARDYIRKSYLALYLEDCRRRGKKPRDMAFAFRK